MLVECCFVDSQLDANMWNVENMGKAIAEGILGHAVVVKSATTPVNNVKTAADYLGSVQNIKNVQKLLLQAKQMINLKLFMIVFLSKN